MNYFTLRYKHTCPFIYPVSEQLIPVRVVGTLKSIPGESGHKVGTLWMGYQPVKWHNHTYTPIHTLQNIWSC